VNIPENGDIAYFVQLCGMLPPEGRKIMREFMEIIFLLQTIGSRLTEEAPSKRRPNTG
jgi:hypothetical protein